MAVCSFEVVVDPEDSSMLDDDGGDDGRLLCGSITFKSQQARLILF